MSLKWGIIGTGNIAHTFAIGLQASKTGKLVAVGSRAKESAEKFGKEFGLAAEQCYATYDDLLKDSNVDIVYISTPHPQHYDVAIQAANAGKNILVEKPFGVNEREVVSVIEAAKKNNVFLMEAFMYRCHPQTVKLAEMVKDGVIGQVKIIRGNMSFNGFELGPDSRLWRNELAGGAMLDIGVYPMSFSRLVAGAAQGKAFVEPKQIKGVGHVQPDTKVDEYAIASLEFENGIVAQLFTGIFADSEWAVQVIGSKGHIRVPNLWRPDLTAMGPIQIEVTEFGKETQIIPVPLEQTNLFAIEADAVAEDLLAGRKECRYMTWDDSLGQVRAMDEWRRQIGLSFPADQ